MLAGVGAWGGGGGGGWRGRTVRRQASDCDLRAFSTLQWNDSTPSANPDSVSPRQLQSPEFTVHANQCCCCVVLLVLSSSSPLSSAHSFRHANMIKVLEAFFGCCFHCSAERASNATSRKRSQSQNGSRVNLRTNSHKTWPDNNTPLPPSTHNLKQR